MRSKLCTFALLLMAASPLDLYDIPYSHSLLTSGAADRRLIARYPQIADAIIHIEPPPRET